MIQPTGWLYKIDRTDDWEYRHGPNCPVGRNFAAVMALYSKPIGLVEVLSKPVDIVIDGPEGATVNVTVNGVRQVYPPK